MNLSYFIARRLIATPQRSFSRTIVRIATAAVALSVAVIIVSTALVSGFKKTISEKIFDFWGHVHIGSADLFSVEDLGISRNQPFLPELATTGQITYTTHRKVLGIPYKMEKVSRGGVHHVQAFAREKGIIKTKDRIEGIALKGIGTDFDWEWLKPYLIDGDTLRLSDTLPARQILISETTARRLQVKVGDAFEIYFARNGEAIPRRLTVCGIYKTGMEEYDKRYALIDIRTVQQLRGWTQDQVSGFEVFLDDIRDLDAFGEYIWEELIEGSEVYATTIKELDPNIFDWLELNNLTTFFILALMMIVAVLNMTTTLLILILERTNMIGILKALGQSNWSIRRIFLYHAAYIAGVGLLIGNLLAIGLCLLQRYGKIIRLPEESYYVSVAPVDLTLRSLVEINFLTIAIVLLTLIVPSWLVNRIAPLRAIRFR